MARRRAADHGDSGGVFTGGSRRFGLTIGAMDGNFTIRVPTVDRSSSCKSKTQWDRMILCDGCDRGYHTTCLMPTLEEIPPGD